MPRIRVNRALPIDLSELPAATFEELTCALMDKERGIVGADLFRVQRQEQFGIDVLAERDDGDFEVASCKCYGSLKKGQLAEFSDDFLNHWDSHWSAHGIRRFVLAVTTMVNSAQREAEIAAERQRFEAVGVRYEVWGLRQLQERLRPHRGIVAQYVGEDHVDLLCGPSETALASSQGALQFVADGPTAGALEEFRASITRQVGHRLDSLLGALRSGRTTEVGATLEAIAAGADWAKLDAPTQARALRLRASVCLARDDEMGARRLADEADALDRSSEPRLRARLAHLRDGADEALRILGEPSTADGAHLRASFLLEKGDVQAALLVLDGHPAVRQDDPETLRLRVLAALLSNDRANALSFADAASLAAPERPAVRWIWAVARYASALSPAVGKERTLAPNPVALDLVREDDAARAHLLEALGTFKALSVGDVPPPARRAAEAFALACLCNIRDRSADAADCVARLLGEDPAWAVVAHWALARGIPVDVSAVRRAIEERLAAGEGDTEHVLFLATLAESEEGPATAAALIRTWSTIFDGSAGDRELRHSWLAGLERCGTEADGGAEPGPISVVPVMEAAAASGDWSAAEALLDRLGKEPGLPPLRLLPVAQALAGAGHWEAVARHLDKLAAFGTAEPIRLAAHAALRTDRPAEALALLRDHRGVFAGGRVPRDLQRVEIEALARVGNQAAAVQAASAAANARDASAQDAIAAAFAHIRTGDVTAAVPYVQSARRTLALHPHDALALAREFAVAAPDVAADLWRQAVSAEPDPALVAPAIDIAIRLGLDREAAPLVGRLGELSGQEGTGVLALDLESVLRMIRERREAGERIARLHLDGRIPIHVASAQTGSNLADFMRLTPGSDPIIGTHPLLIMHGARSRNEDELWEIGAGPLHVDITALLVADQLGLLDALERLAGRVLLPPSLPAALRELEQRMRPGQPRRVDAARRVLDLAASGRIARLPTDLDASGGPAEAPRWSVGFERVDGRTGATEIDARPSMPPRANVRALLDGLLDAGRLDADAHTDAATALGREGAGPAIGRPLAGELILLEAGVAAVLADADAMDATARTFRIVVPADDLQHLQAEVSESDRREREAERLSRLRMRVARALQSGAFATVPAPSKSEAAEDGLGPTAACLAELLHASDGPAGTVWIDDRYVNGFARCGQHRLVATPEAVAALARAGFISDGESRAALLKLRAAGAIFLPLDPPEVLHHLFKARIVDGALVESPALAVLRRHVADAVGLSKHLDISPLQSGTGVGEAPFLLALRRLAGDVALAVWLAPGRDDIDRRVRADWAWSALMLDRMPDVGLPGTAAASRRVIMALGYAGLLAGGVQILVAEADRGERTERLRAYMRWVEKAAVPSWVWEDEAFVRLLASRLAALLVGLVDDKPRAPEWTEGVRKHIRGLLAITVSALPTVVRTALLDDGEFCRATGIKPRMVIALGGLEFDASKLWASCSTALRGTEEVPVVSDDGGSTVLLRRSRTKPGRLRLAGALRGTVADPSLGLLSASRSVRERAAHEVVGTLGLEPASAAAAVVDLVSPARVEDRMAAAARVREASPAVRLNNLRDALARQGEPIAASEFEPGDPGTLLAYLGLAAGDEGAVTPRIVRAAEKLTVAFGPGEAVRRLSSLPVPLPASTMDAVCGLPAEERRRLLATLSGRWAGPIQRLHGVRLHRALAAAGRGDTSGLRKALEALAACWTRDVKLMLSLLRRFGDGLRPFPGSPNAVQPAEALAVAWAHADRVTGTLVGAGHDPERAAGFFRELPSRARLDGALVLVPGYDDAAATPASVTSEALLFHGLGYALGEMPPEGAAAPGVGSIDRLRALMSVDGEMGAAPVPWLNSDHSSGQDELGTWFGFRPAWLFAPDADLSREAALKMTGSAFAELGGARSDEADLWLSLALFSRPGLDEERRRLASIAVETADFETMARSNPCGALDALRAAAEIARLARTGIGLARLEGQLVSIVRALAKLGSAAANDGCDGREPAVLVVETVAALVRSADGAASRERFGAVILQAAQAWPEAVSTFRGIVGALAKAEPPDAPDGVWDAWMRLRAMR